MQSEFGIIQKKKNKNETEIFICRYNQTILRFSEYIKVRELQSKHDVMNDVIHKILEFTIGNIFGKDITCREPVHHCDEYQPGSLVELGRTSIKV